MGRIVPEVWAFVAAERKAIQSLRLRLHSSVRQSGSAQRARPERPEPKGSGYLEACLRQSGGVFTARRKRHPGLKLGTTKRCPDDAVVRVKVIMR